MRTEHVFDPDGAFIAGLFDDDSELISTAIGVPVRRSNGTTAATAELGPSWPWPTTLPGTPV